MKQPIYSKVHRKAFYVFAALLALAALPLYVADGADTAEKNEPAVSSQDRLARLGPVLVEFTSDKELEGEWFPSQVEDWVALAIVTRSAGNGPALPQPRKDDVGGMVFGDDREDIIAHLPAGIKVAEIKPIRTREGRVVYIAPNRRSVNFTKKGEDEKVAIAYGTYADSPPVPDYGVLLRQPLLRMHASEDRSDAVPKGKRRFALSVSVIMAVPSAGASEDSHVGPTDEVYSESTMVDVPSTIGDSPDHDAQGFATGFDVYRGAADPDFDAAMRFAAPRVLDDFAVRLGSARIKSDPNGLSVGAPGLDERGKSDIVRKAASSLPGWRNSAALR